MSLRNSIVGLAVMLTATSAAAADYVILDSTADGIEPGIVVASNADISIPDGAQVVLIDPSGETLVVEGPFAGVVSSAASTGDTSVAGALENLTTTRGSDTTVLGAVRGPKIQGGSVTE